MRTWKIQNVQHQAIVQYQENIQNQANAQYQANIQLLKSAFFSVMQRLNLTAEPCG